MDFPPPTLRTLRANRSEVFFEKYGVYWNLLATV